MKVFRYACLLVVILTAVNIHAGPVVLMGIDAEDGGPGAHGPISSYESLISTMLTNVTNGGSNILVIGGGKGADNVTTFWNQIDTDLGSITVSYVNGAANITAQSFSGYALVAVVSDEYETPSGGLSQAEHDALIGRALDLATFVNAGGGLLGFASDLIDPYGWVAQFGNFTFSTGGSYNDITATPTGTALGVTDLLDVCCWHDEFLTYPAYLDILATNASSGNAAAIGSLNVTLFSKSTGMKYYDTNANGQWDGGEPGLEGWQIEYGGDASGSVATDSGGEFTVTLPSGAYSFAEGSASYPWYQSGNIADQSSVSGTATVTLEPDKTYSVETEEGSEVTGLYFGNVCLGAGGGKGIGFWGNKNGAAIFTGGDLSLLVSLNLRNANGSAFNPASYNQYKTWNAKATSTNMAYMLSAQLAAAALNVQHGFVNGSKLILARGTTSANSAGFATVSNVISEANAELSAHANTTSGTPGAAYRNYQEALKNALEGANENRNFVQAPGVCSVPFS